MAQVQKHWLVAKEYYKEFMKWLLIAFMFSIVARAIVYIVSYFTDDIPTLRNFVNFTLDPLMIGLFIVGIISIYGILPQLIKLGITRRDFYKGIVYTACGLVISYTLLISVMSLLEYIIFSSFNISSLAVADIWYYAISLFLSYLVGMFIGVGFYRYGWKVGLVFILVVMVVQVILDGVTSYLFDDLVDASYYFLLSSFGDYIFILLMLWFVYKIIQDAPIKM